MYISLTVQNAQSIDDVVKAILLHGLDAGIWEKTLASCNEPLGKLYAIAALGCPSRILLSAVDAISARGRMQSTEEAFC